MDVQMPVRDGLRAARAIRAASGPNRDTPIVALTAHAFAEDVQRCLEAGMNGHLTKPLRRAELAEALARFVMGGTSSAAPPVGPAVAAESEGAAALRTLEAETSADGPAHLGRVLITKPARMTDRPN